MTDPAGPPPSYEEAQGTAPYPAQYPPASYTGYPPQNPGDPKNFAAAPGYPGANQPYPPQPGPNQSYGYPAQPPMAYPAQGPYPATAGGQTYIHPTAMANQQANLQYANNMGQAGSTNYNLLQRRRKIVFSIAAVVFALIFMSILFRVIL